MSDVSKVMATMMQALQIPAELKENPNGVTVVGDVMPSQPTGAVQPVQQVQPVQPAQQVQPAQPVQPTQPVQQKAEPIIEVPSFTDEVETPAEPEPVQVDEEVDMSDVPDNPAAENFKKLRGAIKEERKIKRTLESQLGEIKSKLEKYEKGEVVPEIIQAKDSEIQRLEKYQQIYDVKSSREYQELIVKPLNEKKQAFMKLAGDYGIPADKQELFARQVMNFDNVKDRNAYLSRYFTDEAGLLEARSYVKELEGLGQKALEAETKALELKQSLQAEYAEREQKERETRAVAFETVTKQSWNKALEKVKEEGVYKALIMDPTNPEYNKSVVEPIQHKAATQLGALIKKLEANGLKTLPDDLAYGLARMVMLTMGGAMSLNSQAKLEKQVSVLQNNMSNLNGLMRPNIGISNGNMAPSAPKEGPKSPRDAALEASKYFK